MTQQFKRIAGPVDVYTRDLTAALRPKYGPLYAPLLARAYVDFTEDRPSVTASVEAARIYRTEARQRFEQRVRTLKAAWAEPKGKK